MDKLLQPAVSGDDISHLQRYIGQSLLGENFSQTFLLLTGTGGGRKSTLVNIEKKIIKRTKCTELCLETAAAHCGFYSKKSPCGGGRAASPLVLRTRRLQSIFRRPRSAAFRAAYAVLMP